jgi:hypothetical protein
MRAFSQYKAFLQHKGQAPGPAVLKPSINQVPDKLIESIDQYMQVLQNPNVNASLGIPNIGLDELGENIHGPESYFKALPKFLYILYSKPELAENQPGLIKEYKKLLLAEQKNPEYIKQEIDKIIKTIPGNNHDAFVTAIFKLFKISDFFDSDDFKGIQTGGSRFEHYPPRNLDFLLEEQEAWEELAEAHAISESEYLPPLPVPPIVSVIRPFKKYIDLHSTDALEEARESLGLLNPSELTDLMHHEHNPVIDRIIQPYRQALPDVPEEWLPVFIKCDSIHL